jgi:ankyrin repeat protein
LLYELSLLWLSVILHVDGYEYDSSLFVLVNKEILYILISFGCAVDTQDRFGETALHVAANKSAQNVQMLLDAGSPVNIQDNAGILVL